MQTLPDGNVIVGWGDAGTFAEYNGAGDPLLTDSLPAPTGTVTLPTGQTIPDAWSTYRVFKEQWSVSRAPLQSSPSTPRGVTNGPSPRRGTARPRSGTGSCSPARIPIT